jgi:hypothetical protein
LWYKDGFNAQVITQDGAPLKNEEEKTTGGYATIH